MAESIFGCLRIVDASMGWAGPMATMMFADMGAQVIKIEACNHLDWWRMGAGAPEQKDEKIWERSPYFNMVNRNKYGITLDLTTHEGAAVFKRLVMISDIVIENFTPRVMVGFGLGYEALKEVNPKLIMASITAFGHSGPWRDYQAYGQTTESMIGLPALCGYEGGPPVLQGTSYADPTTALNAVIALLMALRHREVTGHGQHIDLSHMEGLTPHIGGPLMDFIMNKRIGVRRGNTNPSFAPHGCYRCKGDDRWVAIAVTSDKEWQGLCDAMGLASLATNERFRTIPDRLTRREELDAIVEGWSKERDSYEVMGLLQAAGVPAGPVADPIDLLQDPHLRERKFFETIDRDIVGSHPYPGVSIRFSSTPGTVRKASPILGEDNNFVLAEILGFSQKEIIDLQEKRIIGVEPIW